MTLMAKQILILLQVLSVIVLFVDGAIPGNEATKIMIILHQELGCAGLKQINFLMTSQGELV